MRALTIILIWTVPGILFYYVLEPYLRLRCNIKLAKEKVDQEMTRFFGGVFWPTMITVYPLIKFVLYPFFMWLSKTSDRVDDYWAKQSKPKIEPEKEIDHAKSGYRDIKLKE